MSEGSVQPLLFDGIAGRSAHAAEKIAWRIAQLWNRFALPLQKFCWIPQESAYSCGAIALLHASQYLLGSPAPLWHLLPGLNAAATQYGGLARVRAAGGLSKEQEQEFRKILLDRGVKPTLVDERIAAAVARIGAAPLAKALAHRNPWPALKAAASQPASSFKFVTADELEAQIESRATSQRFGSAVPQGKTKKQGKTSRKQPTALHVDPSHLQLLQGSFVAAGGGPLAQLSFHEVQAQKVGVAFCTAAQMQPFLADFHTLSIDALALVSTAVLPDDILAGLPATTIRYPATYAPTGEPILIRGTILQLGDESVELAKQDITELEPVQTVAMRMSVYKDEAGLDWQEFSQAPIKCVFGKFPCAKTAPARATVLAFTVRWTNHWNNWFLTSGHGNGLRLTGDAPPVQRQPLSMHCFAFPLRLSNIFSVRKPKVCTLSLGLRMASMLTQVLRSCGCHKLTAQLPNTLCVPARRPCALPGLAVSGGFESARRTRSRYLRPFGRVSPLSKLLLTLSGASTLCPVASSASNWPRF